MRGEYFLAARSETYLPGSPPHAWRILIPEASDFIAPGITSTCVENTSTLNISLPTIRDHLHMRGEYLPCGSSTRNGLGSPPHAWRIRGLLRCNYPILRITSTCVENTCHFGWCLPSLRDHLHMRGEYSTILY